jgi:hypothetical protein
MPKLKLEINEQELHDYKLREGLLDFVSDDDAIQFVEAMLRLMASGDLAFWLSPKLVRRVMAFAAEQQEENNEGIGEIDQALFASWLLQVGSIEPNVRWEVESLPNNGGIYRMLLQGGKNEDVHNNQG